jgi:hypothetical protein
VVALDPLATAADLQARKVDVSDTARVAAALASASSAVRDAAEVPISRVTSTVKVGVPHGRWLDLPVATVTAVTSITDENDNPVTGWKLLNGRLWRLAGWGSTCEPAELTVTVTHGLADVPADIVDLVCDLATASLLSDGDVHDPRVQSEAIDDSRTTWQSGADGTVSVFELPERTRAALSRRFGGGAYVTGSR